MKFLVIDDEALVRRSLSRALRSKGHEVIEAVDGNDGLEQWKKVHPDLVFLDVLMPGLNGPEVLKEMGHLRSGKVVLMSAFAGEHNMETAQQMGADVFVPKPFEDIFAIVKMAEDLLS
ncbi:response regulator [Bdellovibrio svalbardensis]|uniref:Response regulator n=1 Tax=Bdellovibrio svalbardensis TaxID=2972972 RepID=A0ABT6DJC2_9BACT|nr:response regulator [Bdellovibrio svalbardensis]MDG0816942.1 response regulator [Bdellovibrio svalbardensis]